MQKFYRKSVEVEAVQINEAFFNEGQAGFYDIISDSNNGCVTVLAHSKTVHEGDWIIRDESGNTTTCSKRFFEDRFSPIPPGDKVGDLIDWCGRNGYFFDVTDQEDGCLVQLIKRNLFGKAVYIGGLVEGPTFLEALSEAIRIELGDPHD